METWQRSPYGRHLAFCDFATLAEVRDMWRFYSVERNGIEKQNFERRFESVLQKAKGWRNETASYHTALRSAMPAQINAFQDVSDLHKNYWKYGSTELNAKIRAGAKHANPMFLTLEDESIIHYGTDPLLGFHLAPAYAPLHADDPWFKKIKELSQLERVVAVARMEFREWALSYKKNLSNITVRFCVADAITFGHTLQHKRMTGANTANWYRDKYHSQLLTLDGPDYASERAPLTFDVIDTSNLCDHLGSLTLFTAASPLLRNQLSSVLYADVIVRQHKTHQDILNNMLCGHVPTLSTLLGLFPVEYWTNTSSLSLGDEGMFDVAMSQMGLRSRGDPPPLQMFLRTCWKRPMCTEEPSGAPLGLMKIHFDPRELAHVLYKVYTYMFRDEDYAWKFANMSLEAYRNSNLVRYHRASFASFLRLIKTRVTCDWQTTMDALIGLVENRPGAPMGMNYIQELFTYLHMLDVFSVESLREWHNRNHAGLAFGSIFSPILPRVISVDEKWGDLRDWKSIPPVVCVSLKVPRNRLSTFTNMGLKELNTPTVHCMFQDTSAGMSSWQNIFPACQLSFGNITTSGDLHSDSFEVHVANDPLEWRGKSPLVVSCYVSTFFLLLNPQKTSAAFGIHITPASIASFMPKLGPSMILYETTLDNSNNVYITRYAPNQNAYPIVPGFSKADLVSSKDHNVGADTSLIAGVDQETGRIAALTARLDLISDDYKSSLKDRCQVEHFTLSPCQFSIGLGQKQRPLTLFFPVFAVEGTRKTRIARKSSYVEDVVQVATSSEWMKYPYFMYPVLIQRKKPVNWNMPYIELENCPVIDIKKQSKLNWLITHVSMAMSARERSLREYERLPRSTGEQIRLDFKESLFSMFMQYAGVQGRKDRIFGLSNPENGGVHILIFVSNLRIDLASRAVVLDCAVLPLYTELMPKLNSFLAALSSRGFIQIKVDDAELRLWKHILPAYVERCRSWEHGADCQYARAGAVPLTVEDQKQFLCRCGNGRLPPRFVENVTHWNAVSQYAVRAAISPAFWAPFVDDIYQPGPSGAGPAASRPPGPGLDRCANCGTDKGKDGGALLSCARCVNVKYCSRECQRLDWKAHKPMCK
ncbi:hypothetical protein DL766_005074 [Monosporascus sp. MC13-8B]|uniref:MYND-type domain-containing protein n=1 Tax=Monosporascus cannonballus TaxID=155416 RepID=A0ABY0HCE6_9PEZI|nr:hypothetical protein DL763_007075 [Monosporascus cannonballus]RYO89386.1 hypothetical protein DL762_003277 [Monosporascus cannonballus]RYP30053.1 hypothetical protein DL766_005074 [Monosporascus sp. MC13-8B]